MTVPRTAAARHAAEEHGGEGGGAGRDGVVRLPTCRVQFAQGWPLAELRPLIGILSQNTGPSHAIRTSPVQFGTHPGTHLAADGGAHGSRRWRS
jgi:hypothetical protein